MTKELMEEIPPLYSTDNVRYEDKTIYVHYYIPLLGAGQFDWWMCEYNPEDRIFYGYANLNDSQNAEWGYISLDELEELGLVVRERNFTPTPAKELGFLEE